MRFAHTGDLHIGKRLHEQSLLEDQREVLWQMLDKIEEQRCEALIIAGDIYDKPSPSVEAVKLFDEFIYQARKRKIRIIAISGNHDSMERISFGSRIMMEQGVYFQENFNGKAQKIQLEDEYGELNVYLVPFVKPVHVGKDDYEEAFARIMQETKPDYSKRNILVAHQFFTGTPAGMALDGEALEELTGMPIRSDSESVNVGGLDNISYELVKKFDYVALGHLHRRQCIGEEHIRYSGSPLKYSFSEGNDEKSFEVIDLKEKGTVEISRIELTMPRDLRTIKGTLEHLVSHEVVDAEGVSREDYICAIITGDSKVTSAVERLRRWYPNLLKVEYMLDKSREEQEEIVAVEGKTPLQLFRDFYKMINDKSMTKEQEKIVSNLLGGEDSETD